jgi:hypothetical protein
MVGFMRRGSGSFWENVQPPDTADPRLGTVRIGIQSADTDQLGVCPGGEQHFAGTVEPIGPGLPLVGYAAEESPSSRRVYAGGRRSGDNSSAA